MAARVRWLGGAGLEVEHSGARYLVDPLYTRPGRFSVLVGWPRARRDVVERKLHESASAVRAVVISHTHVDHVLDAPVIAGLTEAKFVGSESLRNLLRPYGFSARVVVCEGGETVVLGPGVQVHMLPSAHGKVLFGWDPLPGKIADGVQPPLHAWQYRHGRVFLPVLEIGKALVAHVGSANLDQARARWNRPVDLLFLCVPGWKAVPHFLSILRESMRPKKVVPFHYDDFTRNLEPGRPLPLVPRTDQDGFVRELRHEMPSAAVEVVRPYEWLEMET